MVRIRRCIVASSGSSLALYIEHRDELLNYANKLLQDRAIAEDVVQEAWIRLSAKDGQGDEITNPLNYLFAIVRNLALDWVRRRPRDAPSDTRSTKWEAIPDNQPSAEEIILHRDQMRLLMDAISELPERTQIAFRMYRIEEKTLQQIADHLNISVARTFQLVRDAGVHATQRFVRYMDKTTDRK
jgi:RNA polymerase sigma-70 factor (ECF subfamily)